MRVDHGTALPPGRMFGFSRPNKVLPVAIISVDPGTPAWNAGLRPGQFVQKVGSRLALTPDSFYATTKKIDGPVELTIVDGQDREREVIVQSEVARADAETSNPTK